MGGIALAVAGAGAGLALVIAAMVAAVAVLSVARGRHRKALATRRLRCLPAARRSAGAVGVVRSWGAGGQVLVDGALWRARNSWPDEGAELGWGTRSSSRGTD